MFLSKKAFLFLATVLALPVNAQFQVTDLRVEHLQNPSVVDNLQPRLSWINNVKNNKLRNQKQTAYQIAVASSAENLKKGVFDVWDTGQTPSTESTYIKYKGKKLESGQDYYWQVRTWNQEQKVSDWSATGHWGMGLLRPDEWKAKWIGTAQNDMGVPLFRKNFDVASKIKKAKVFVTGLGYFELYVNGQRVGNDYLVPNFTNYTSRDDLTRGGIKIDYSFSDYRVLYLAYDVTDLLQQGKNAIGAALGGGFYNKTGHGSVSKFGDCCLLCQLQITFEDGKQLMVATDESWLTKPSAITLSGVYDGELYNANLETPDWAKSNCDETNWKKAVLAKAPIGKLTAHTSPTDKILETLAPVSLEQLPDGKYEVDFGKEISGWIRFLNVEGQKGDTLKVRYVCESPVGTENYVFKGTGKESYAPRFTWFAFSKAIISGIADLKANQLQAEAVNTDVPIAAEFSTSNPLFNKINEIWQRSQLDNMHGCIASDCPHRERLPYTGDGEAAMETVLENFDAAAFYQKWIRDMRDSQHRETGYVPNGAPWEPGCGGGVAWGAAMTIMPWQYYLQYGDRKMLEDSYRAMKAQVRHMTNWITPDSTMFQQKSNVSDSNPNYWLNLGDWCPPFGLPKDELVHTFYLWLCADYTARAAHALGLPQEQKAYQTLANNIRYGFNRKFYDAENKTYGDFGSNIYALRMGIPAERKADVVASLRKEIMETHTGHINTGFLATKYFFETLSENGLTEVAYTAMNKTDYPSYGHWIAQGATTTWEQWDGQNSHNHPMFGSGLTWFYRYLAGVNTDEAAPGFRHIIVRPYLTDQLTNVSYSYQSPYGKVGSEIIQKNGKTQINVTVPVGSYATVYLPTSDTSAVKESGKALEKMSDLKVIGMKEGRYVVEVPQGNYQFSF